MQPEDLVGQALGHYNLMELAGRGGMATVFRAEDIHLGREVAIKVFLPQMMDSQDFLRRFAREARVLAQLDHPQILPVYDYGEQGDMAYLVMPYLSGGSLKDLLEERKALPPSEAARLMEGVLSALQYAHDRNVIHRDIKPGNLLFKADGTLMLADFGLARVIEGDGQGKSLLVTLSNTQTVAGTPEYMAPEQIEGKVMAASDIYAMGVVLYEMVTGLRPFTGETLLSILMKQINEPPRPPREVNPYISTQFEKVILRALEKDPARRFARPADMQMALMPALNRPSNSGIADLPASADGKTSLVSSTTREGSADPYSTVQSSESNPGQSNPAGRPGQNLSAAQASSAAGLAAGSTERNTPNQGPSRTNAGTGYTLPQNSSSSPANQAGRGNNPQNPLVLSGPQAPNAQPMPTQFAQPQPQQINPGYQQGAGRFAQGPGNMPQAPGTFAQQPAQANWTVPPGTSFPSYPMPEKPRASRAPVIVIAILLLLLAGLITSLFFTPLGDPIFRRNQTTPIDNGQSTPITNATAVTVTGVTPQPRGVTPTAVDTTKPIKTTTTDCPASGTARAAVTAPLQLGKNASIVYLVNEVDGNGNPTDGIIRTFNTSTQAKNDLVKIDQGMISEAQVSADGQWVMFVAQFNGAPSQLRMIRLDGQGQQTLFCSDSSSTIDSVQWSFDEKHVVFSLTPTSTGLATLYLLTTQKGTLQVAIKANAASSGVVEKARTWLDDGHVLLTGVVPNSDAGPQNVFLLDITTLNQDPAAVPVIFANDQSCWDFDSSYDSTKIFITRCNPGTPTGSSKITYQPLQGNSSTPVLTSTTESFNTIRIINPHDDMLANASNTAMGGPDGDPAHDGLYLVKKNGSKQRLFAPTSGTFCSLNGYSQYYWGNVSRDSTLYAFVLSTGNSGAHPYSLYYGSLGGGSPQSFTDSTQPLTMVGWTTL